MASSRRKGWESLSPAYRKRLQRGGITKSSYGKGASLHKARGKKSAQHENTQRRFWRIVDKSGIDRGEVQDVIDTIGFDEASDILTHRDMALSASDPIQRHLSAGAMRVLYGVYEGIVPREWLYYGAKGAR